MANKSLVVNGERFRLPEDEIQISSIMNHIELVKAGRKSFAKLYRAGDGQEGIFHKSYLDTAEIEVDRYTNYE
jgi:hypothetical protein